MNQMRINQAKLDFLGWAKKRVPHLYAKAIHGYAGLGDVTATDTPASSQAGLVDSVMAQIGKLGTAYAQYKGQQSIINLNIERAKQGLPPIDAGDVAPQANVGIASSTRTMMYVGIAAMLAVGAMMAFGRRR